MDQTSRHSDLRPYLPWADQWLGGLNRGSDNGGGRETSIWPPWRNNLEFPIAYVDITHTCCIPIMRTSPVKTQTWKTCFFPYGSPMMRVDHGVSSNEHLGSSKLVRFTWDTALYKCK